MPFEPNEYQSKILRGRRLIQRRSLDQLERNILRDWFNELRGVLRQLRSGSISPEGADRLRRQITAALQRWTSSVDGSVKVVSEGAIDGVRQLHQELLKQAEANTNVSLSYSFEGFNVDAMESMFVRRGINVVNSFKTLQNLNVSDNVRKPIANVIQSGIRSGNWQQTTTKLADLLSFSASKDLPDIQELNRIARRQGVSVFDIMQQGIDNVDLGALSEFEETQVKSALKRLSYNARRIAQTEIDVAAHEGERVAAVRSPIVQGLQWKTSGRHRTLRSAPDVCDVFEQFDFQGLGKGVYYPETLPSKPHPFDGCTRLYVFKKQKNWTQDRETPQEPATITQSQVQSIMGSNLTSESRTLTPNFVAYTTAQANRYVQLAWQSWQQEQTEVA